MNSFSHPFSLYFHQLCIRNSNILIHQLQAFSLHFLLLLYMMFIALHFLKVVLGDVHLFPLQLLTLSMKSVIPVLKLYKYFPKFDSNVL